MTEQDVKEMLDIMNRMDKQYSRTLTAFSLIITGLNITWMLSAWYFLSRLHQ